MVIKLVRSEASELLTKIQAHRQSFLITQKTLEEWHRILEPYEFADVEKSLDEFFSNSSNWGIYPDAYKLVKHLRTVDEKQKAKDKDSIRVRCPICGKVFGLSALDEHYGRCSSIDYLVKNQKKYFDKEVSEETIQKLFEASDEKFDEVYINFIKRLKPVVNTGNELDAINKLLNGQSCDVSLDGTVTGLKKQLGGSDEN